MGICFSKKPTTTTTNSSSPCPPPDPPVQCKSNPELEKKKAVEEPVKKEIFVIKHRKSHEIDRRSDEEKAAGAEKAVPDKGVLANSNVINGGLVATGVRTSSCTKEEVDAILIQCGRLSRSSSTGKAAASGSGGGGSSDNMQRSRKYSGSKRSYDFDNEIGDGDKKKGNGSEENSYDENGGGVVGGGDEEAVVERIHRHRQRQRQSRAAASSPHGRRRTPSRERDQQQQQQQRSGSRERGSSGGGGGGRVSRSPGRRSESPITTCSGGGTGSKPGKMVAVPATVSSLAMDKSTNGDAPSVAAVKRIQVRRNVGDPTVGGGRSAASPRSQSPARVNAQSNQQPQQQPLSLSRSNSRKAEQSPYGRNPLNEIDTNVIGFEQSTLPGNKSTNISPLHQKPNAENISTIKVVAQGTENRNSSNRGTLDNNAATLNLRVKEQQQQQMVEEAKAVQPAISNVAVPMIPSAVESLKPQTLTRSRSSRRSRDLNINPESLLNPNPSYTALLLEDIQNFHQKNTPSFSLPACLTKANSILEAVADLNSSTSSNLSCAFSDDRRRNLATDQFNKNDENSSSTPNPALKKRAVESEVNVIDDLMLPSFHKYVTLRRGPMEGEDMEEQESSGSNSFVGGQPYWLSSSTWEPNSADSTDRWTSSRSTNTKEDDFNPLGLQRHPASESGPVMEEAPRRLTEKKREPDHQHTGIGRGRVGSGRGLYITPTTAAAST